MLRTKKFNIEVRKNQDAITAEADTRMARLK